MRPPRRASRRDATLKRAIDVAGAVAGVAVSSPLMAAVAVAVRVGLGRPVLFRQERPGLHGVPFTLYKFRTMRDSADADGRPLPDGERLTVLGRFLRSTSLDELPEFFNVLVGDMSLVGPRPLLMQYLDIYSPEQARRHEVKPGVTGYAQVMGRNALTWEEKFALDVWYVDHWSIGLDVRILLSTVAQVLSRRGVTEPGHDTTEPFTGAGPYPAGPGGH